MIDGYLPVIKWSGSKRSQAESIIQHFPEKIDTYYEPFVGGGSILNALMLSNRKIKHYVCSDINKDLISLFSIIKSNPYAVVEHYAKLWSELNADHNISRKRTYFESVRDRLNKEHDPLDFMFIMRTTINGMPRYNSNGEFNNSFHLTRNGIRPTDLAKIIYGWSNRLNQHNVDFINCSFEMVSPKSQDDFVYLDPPYYNTHGMYYGTINYGALYNYMRSLPCSYALSFDGNVTYNESGVVVDSTVSIPTDIYDEHIYLVNGNSGFRRVIGKSNDTTVRESLYIKR